MNIATLIELAEKWEKDAEEPKIQQGGTKDADIANAKGKARREQLKDCANDLRLLVRILG